MQADLNLKADGGVSHLSIADRLSGSRAGTVSLGRKSRPHETFIQTLLFICGAVSILTTVGIVLVLGNESLNFFTKYGLIEIGRSSTTALSATDTTVTLSEGGSPVLVGQILEIGAEGADEEFTRITGLLDNNTVTVERGVEGTTAVEHEAGATVAIAKRPTVTEFLTNSRWQPQAGEFGIAPLVVGTLVTSLIAMLLAAPIGLGVAIYLSQYASKGLRSVLKPVLEILAGIPTVVYGYFALTFITPLLRSLLGVDNVEIYNKLSAGLAMGIMIIPTISSMSEDALSAVPRTLKEASMGIGGTKFETIVRVLIPAALSGIIAAFILAISRAFGETMIVAVAAGAGPNINPNPLIGGETMTGHIARISTGDLSYGSIDYSSLFAIGLTLFIVTLSFNLLGNFIRNKFREAY